MYPFFRFSFFPRTTDLLQLVRFPEGPEALHRALRKANLRGPYLEAAGSSGAARTPGLECCATSEDAGNYRRLVLGCIEAKFCK